MTTIARVETRTATVRLHTPFVTALRRTETTDTVVVTITDSDGSRMPSEDELGGARYQGRRIAEVATKLFG